MCPTVHGNQNTPHLTTGLSPLDSTIDMFLLAFREPVERVEPLRSFCPEGDSLQLMLAILWGLLQDTDTRRRVYGFGEKLVWESYLVMKGS